MTWWKALVGSYGMFSYNLIKRKNLTDDSWISFLLCCVLSVPLCYLFFFQGSAIIQRPWDTGTKDHCCFPHRLSDELLWNLLYSVQKEFCVLVYPSFVYTDPLSYRTLQRLNSPVSLIIPTISQSASHSSSPDWLIWWSSRLVSGSLLSLQLAFLIARLPVQPLTVVTSWDL